MRNAQSQCWSPPLTMGMGFLDQLLALFTVLGWHYINYQFIENTPFLARGRAQHPSVWLVRREAPSLTYPPTIVSAKTKSENEVKGEPQSVLDCVTYSYWALGLPMSPREPLLQP